MKVSSITLFAVASFTGISSAHTWLDQIQAWRNGKWDGPVGFIRKYVPRGSPTVDVDNTWRINTHSDRVCKHGSRDESKMLKGIRPGDTIRGTYLENGHITKNADGHVSGKAKWFMSTGSPNPSHGEIDKWPASGDNRFLAEVNYDDGKCAEGNDSKISKERGLGPGKPGRACHAEVKIPNDVKPGKITLYWVWNYSIPGKQNHVEFYGSCMDVEITGGNSKLRRNAKFRRQEQIENSVNKF